MFERVGPEAESKRAAPPCSVYTGAQRMHDCIPLPDLKGLPAEENMQSLNDTVTGRAAASRISAARRKCAVRSMQLISAPSARMRAGFADRIIAVPTANADGDDHFCFAQ